MTKYLLLQSEILWLHFFLLTFFLPQMIDNRHIHAHIQLFYICSPILRISFSLGDNSWFLFIFHLHKNSFSSASVLTNCVYISWPLSVSDEVKNVQHFSPPPGKKHKAFPLFHLWDSVFQNYFFLNEKCSMFINFFIKTPSKIFVFQLNMTIKVL